MGRAAPRKWLSSAEAAARLGVKPETLYAYVSRGLLHSRREAGGRTSSFDPDEVERLARRGRREPGRAPAVVIESALTAIQDGTLWYRGADARALARSRSFEEVAAWLWTGRFDQAADAAWSADPRAVAAAAACQAALPPATLPLDRLRVAAAALAAADDLRLELHPTAVVATGRSLLAGLVEALPPAGAGPGGPVPADRRRPGPAEADRDGPGLAEARRGRPGSIAVDQPGAVDQPRAVDQPSPVDQPRGIAVGRPGGIAARLWRRLCPSDPGPGMVAALDAALVLLADHELAASTLAARVAASVRADPYAVVLTGLGVLSGAQHGGASLAVEAMLAAAGEPAAAAGVIGARLRRGEGIPGLGHPLYPDGDPRAAELLERVRALAGPAPAADPACPARLAVVEAVLDALGGRRLPPPNVDFALAALAHVTGMRRGAAEAVFAVGRTAGWLAHALEEYERATPIRPRATYVGPAPGGWAPGGATARRSARPG